MKSKKEISSLVKMCLGLKKEFPDKDLDFYKMLIAVEILKQVIGIEWANQTIFKQHKKLDKKNRDAFIFFNSYDTGYIWQTRVYFFGEYIYNLRKVQNFDLLKKEIEAGHLVSRFAEIEVGKHLMQRNINFEFVNPSGKKTEDFDIRIKDELNVNCEVKHKIESTILSESTIINTLRRANRQLPKSEPGIIFLKIPQRWSEDSTLVIILNKVLVPFFQRNNSHLMGILLRWEEQNSLSKGLFYFKYKLLRNEFFDCNELAEKFLNKLEDSVNLKNWVSLENIIMNYML